MKNDLAKLIEYISENQTFTFKESNVSFKCDDLITMKVLERQPNQVKVISSSLFTDAFYQYFVSKLDFCLTNDFHSVVEFYRKIENHFREAKKGIIGITEQMNNLLVYLIKKVNEDFGVTFEDFAITLNKDNQDEFLYRFNTSFFSCLDELKIEAEDLYPSVIHLYEQVNSDVYYNMNLGELTNGVRRFCIKNPDKGIQLLELHKERESRPIDSIHSAMLIGLYKSNRVGELERIKELLKDDINHTSVVCAISAFEPESNAEAINLLNVIEETKSVDENFVINLPKLYTNFINNKNISDPEILKRCFSKLQELANSDSLEIKKSTMWHVRFVEDHDKEIFKIVDSFNKAPLQDDMYGVINEVLTSFKDQAYFFHFLRSYSVHNKMKFESKKFEFPISKFENQDSSAFSKHLIYLLIDNEGAIRFIGKRILSHLTVVVHRNYQFKYDILKLPALDQIKLWVSVFQDKPQPKYSLPLLLPLRKSSSSIVVESFIYKLEELIESYSSALLSVLQEQLNLNEEDDKTLLARVNSKYEEFSEYWDKKVAIKELNPLYVQSKIYEIYEEQYHENISSSFEDSIAENSPFLNHMTTITLAKGGGWKHKKEGKVSQLSSVGTSFQFPRDYNLAPERFDFNIRVTYVENWENEFTEWEAALSSSENI